MKVLVLYRPHSEHARKVEEFARDYKRQTNKDIELLDVDTREGQSKAQVYEAMDYPTFLAVREDNGQLLRMWQGQPLPMIGDISYYDDGRAKSSVALHEELTIKPPHKKSKKS